MLISEKDGSCGFSFTKLSHCSGFEVSEQRFTMKVLIPSDESLHPERNSKIKLRNLFYLLNGYIYKWWQLSQLRKVFCVKKAGIPSGIRIICKAVLNLHGTWLIYTNFVHIIAALPMSGPSGVPNPTNLLKLDSFQQIQTQGISVNVSFDILF